MKCGVAAPLHYYMLATSLPTDLMYGPSISTRKEGKQLHCRAMRSALFTHMRA